MQGKTLGQLAELVGGTVQGDSDLLIKGVSTLSSAAGDEITFLNNMKYQSQLKDTKAGAVIIAEAAETNASLLIVNEPYYALMEIVVELHGHREHQEVGIGKQASISETAQIGENCNIHNFATVSDNAVIGKNCQIYPGVFVGPNVVIGDGCILYANVVIYDGCTIGNRVIIHANATVGEDGFGFATDKKGCHHKIPHIGKVIIEDDVELGASMCVERGTLEDTIICCGCKLGDMVTIGHGAKIGAHSLLVPFVGIAGSTEIGHHCVIGGQVGIAGHLKIGNMVRIAAQSGVGKNVPDGAAMMGSPAMDANKAMRAYAVFGNLPEIRNSVRKLKKRVSKLEDSGK